MEKSTFKRRLMFVVCMLMCGLSIQAADDGLITDQVTIDKLVAGTLPQRISSDEKYLITNLKINGQINGTDLRLIREMAGRSIKNEETEGKLTILDLANVKIVSGGDYYTSYYEFTYYTQDDSLGVNAFANCNLTSVTLPTNLKYIAYGTFENCYALTSVTLPPNLRGMTGGNFNNCRSLTNLNLPSSLTSIGESAFNNCRSLTNLNLPSNLTSIGESAFNNCRSLTNLNLPSSLTFIGVSAFSDCKGLTSLTLSPNIIVVGQEAFGHCSNLSTLTIPQGLTSIARLNQYHIFSGSGLESVYVAWQTPVPAGFFFDDFDISKCTLYVPLGTKQAYSGTEVWREFGEIKEYDVSGVGKVDNHSEAKEVSRYSLDGQRLSAPVKGLNIVRYSDGSIKKVVVN